MPFVRQKHRHLLVIDTLRRMLDQTTRFFHFYIFDIFSTHIYSQRYFSPFSCKIAPCLSMFVTGVQLCRKLCTLFCSVVIKSVHIFISYVLIYFSQWSLAVTSVFFLSFFLSFLSTPVRVTKKLIDKTKTDNKRTNPKQQQQKTNTCYKDKTH